VRSWKDSFVLLGWLACGCGGRSDLPIFGDETTDVTLDDQSVVSELDCPTDQSDPRLPELVPGEEYVIDGALFVRGVAQSFHWEIGDVDCDAVVASPSYTAGGTETSSFSFRPGRPARYEITMEAGLSGGRMGSCTFEVAAVGRGLRVELCWDTSTSVDLDLYLHTPENIAPFFYPSALDIVAGLNGDTCNSGNCGPELRFELPRVDFGYADSPVEFCDAGPAMVEYRALGYCPNPRASNDNNQVLVNGTTEIIQLDRPLGHETFRVMVSNFSNEPAQPYVFVYCDGRLVTEAQPPAFADDFQTLSPGVYGVMWRPFDITTIRLPDDTLQCEATRLVHPSRAGDYVTVDDPSY
jgi:hypothetical protein